MPKGQSIMDNPETMVTLGNKRQDEDNNIQQKYNTENKKMSNTDPRKTGSEAMCL